MIGMSIFKNNKKFISAALAAAVSMALLSACGGEYSAGNSRKDVSADGRGHGRRLFHHPGADLRFSFSRRLF